MPLDQSCWAMGQYLRYIPTEDLVAELRKRDAIDCVDKEWVIKYCDMMTAEKTEFFEKETRSRNDSYSNGSYAGSIHTLRDLKQLMETMKRLDEKKAKK